MQEFIAFVEKLAQSSGEIIKQYFRAELIVDSKDDGTPVTIADKKSELVMREMIQREFPLHGILGEEFDDVRPDAEYQWILDPIDGTKTFVSGAPLFGTLIGLLKNGKPILGVINNPILNQSHPQSIFDWCEWCDPAQRQKSAGASLRQHRSSNGVVHFALERGKISSKYGGIRSVDAPSEALPFLGRLLWVLSGGDRLC